MAQLAQSNRWFKFETESEENQICVDQEVSCEPLRLQAQIFSPARSHAGTITGRADKMCCPLSGIIDVFLEI